MLSLILRGGVFGPTPLPHFLIMKKTALILSVTIPLGAPTHAQNADLPKDHTGMITFQEVTEAPGLPHETLYQNAVSFLSQVEVVNQKKKENYLVEEEGKATTMGGFLVYNYKSPDGEIRYDISIEVKDNKYRYSITNFIFHPYTRNRYGRFEMEKWKSKSLEDPVSKGEEKSWNRHKIKTSEKMASLISKMAVAMESLPAVAEDSKPAKEANW